MRSIRFLLLPTLAACLLFGSYSCKKDKINNNNEYDEYGEDDEDDIHPCDNPLDSYSITFTGQDLVQIGSTNLYKYDFMIDTIIVNKTVNFLMDWGCIYPEKVMYLELNQTSKDSLSTLSWNWADVDPGTPTFSAANLKEGPGDEHTIGVSLVERGVGQSYIYLKDSSYTDLGIENYYDPNGQYKLTFVFYME